MMRVTLFLAHMALAACLGTALLLAGCSLSREERVHLHCPMHPQVISDKPGDCPICGMKLVPAEKAAGEGTPGPAKPGAGGEIPGRATVAIAKPQGVGMGLGTSVASPRNLSREVITSAVITVDETRLHQVTTKVEGWVETLHVNTTGQIVRKGQPLLTLYSPALWATQEEYLSALAAEKRLAESGVPGVAQGGSNLVRAARRRLELWDVSPGQIAALEGAGQPQRAMTIFSPASGYISEKSVAMGHRVMPGEILFSVSDLSVVWAEADIYESDLRYIQVGMAVTLTLPYWPGKSFPGRISFLNPFIDPQTRTLKARLEIPNPDVLLKPQMYGEMSLSLDLGKRLAVPASAIMRTGRQSFAFVETGGMEFAPTAVSIGERSGDYFEVLSGLQEGDRVVTSANFLVDSESSLKAALQAVAGSK